MTQKTYKIRFKNEHEFNYCLCTKFKDFRIDYIEKELIFEDKKSRQKVLDKLLKYKIYEVWITDE